MGQKRYKFQHYTALFLLGMTLNATAATPQPLHEQIDAILSRPALSDAQVSMQIVSLKNGAVLFEKNPTLVLNPASNVKMVTAMAALKKLGASYRFPTRFFTLPSSTNENSSDLWIQGFGDPFLVSEEVQKVILELKKLSLPSIQNIGVDASYFDKQHYIRYHSPVSHETDYVLLGPLSFNFNRDFRYLHRKKMTLQEVIDQPKQSDLRRRDTHKNPSVEAAKVFKKALTEAGIAVHGKIKEAPLPANATLFYEHLSQPLSEIILGLGKYSNNFSATQLVKVLGAATYEAPGSTEKGLKALRDFLTSKGIAPTSYTLESGSGLSYENRFSAECLVTLLSQGYRDKEIKEPFTHSLSSAGEDGTLKKRFLDSKLKSRLKGKTGTLAGVSALSGYVLGRHDVYCFSILINGFDGESAPLEALEDEILNLVFGPFI